MVMIRFVACFEQPITIIMHVKGTHRLQQTAGKSKHTNVD